MNIHLPINCWLDKMVNGEYNQDSNFIKFQPKNESSSPIEQEVNCGLLHKSVIQIFIATKGEDTENGQSRIKILKVGH